MLMSVFKNKYLFLIFCVSVCVYLAARLGPSFLWDFDGFFGLSLQSDPLGPVSRQAAPGSPGARHWPSWARHGIFQPACSLRPAQLKNKRRDKESSGVTLMLGYYTMTQGQTCWTSEDSIITILFKRQSVFGSLNSFYSTSNINLCRNKYIHKVVGFESLYFDNFAPEMSALHSNTVEWNLCDHHIEKWPCFIIS